jgi:hypothetical protein
LKISLQIFAQSSQFIFVETGELRQPLPHEGKPNSRTNHNTEKDPNDGHSRRSRNNSKRVI